MFKQSALQYGLSLINKNYNVVLEFGVYEGRTISKIRNTLNNNYKVYGFDSFVGLPEDWTDQKGKIAGKGRYTKGYFSTNGIVPNINGVKFYKGWFEDTIDEYIKAHDKLCDKIALIHIDCDLYKSAKTVLYKLNDYILKDTILVFDEWIYNNNAKCNDHEQKAFYEWVNDYKRKFELIDYIGILQLNNGDEERKIVKIL